MCLGNLYHHKLKFQRLATAIKIMNASLNFSPFLLILKSLSALLNTNITLAEKTNSTLTRLSEAYSVSCQTSKMKCSAKQLRVGGR